MVKKIEKCNSKVLAVYLLPMILWSMSRAKFVGDFVAALNRWKIGYTAAQISGAMNLVREYIEDFAVCNGEAVVLKKKRHAKDDVWERKGHSYQIISKAPKFKQPLKPIIDAFAKKLRVKMEHEWSDERKRWVPLAPKVTIRTTAINRHPDPRGWPAVTSRTDWEGRAILAESTLHEIFATRLGDLPKAVKAGQARMVKFGPPA